MLFGSPDLLDEKRNAWYRLSNTPVHPDISNGELFLKIDYVYNYAKRVAVVQKVKPSILNWGGIRRLEERDK